MTRNEEGTDLEGRMTVAGCREVQLACAGTLHKRLNKMDIDLALIKKHLGINGQYRAVEHKTRRETDAPTADYAHHRPEDFVIEHKGNVSFPKPPTWLVMLGVGIVLLAGAGLLLLIQTKADLARLKDFQTLNNNTAVQGQQRIERKVNE
jgi:hypothetical protein